MFKEYPIVFLNISIVLRSTNEINSSKPGVSLLIPWLCSFCSFSYAYYLLRLRVHFFLQLVQLTTRHTHTHKKKNVPVHTCLQSNRVTRVFSFFAMEKKKKNNSSSSSTTVDSVCVCTIVQHSRRCSMKLTRDARREDKSTGRLC